MKGNENFKLDFQNPKTFKLSEKKIQMKNYRKKCDKNPEIQKNNIDVTIFNNSPF